MYLKDGLLAFYRKLEEDAPQEEEGDSRRRLLRGSIFGFKGRAGFAQGRLHAAQKCLEKAQAFESRCPPMPSKYQGRAAPVAAGHEARLSSTLALARELDF